MTALYSGRDHSVPCQEIGCRRFTFDDDALCVRHKSTAATSPGRGEAGQDTRASRVLPASSSLSWLPAARDAQQCAAGDGPAPVVGNP